MTFVAVFLVWVSGVMSMAAVLHFSGGERGEAIAYMLAAVGFVIPAVVEMFP